MEECPRCHCMTAEKNHYDNNIICYSRDCLYNEHYDDPCEQEEHPKRLLLLEGKLS